MDRAETKLNRRTLLKAGGAAVLGSLAAPARAANPRASNAPDVDTIGCLIDTTLCIGCRKCEQACNASNELPKPVVPFDHKSVFARGRRPHAAAYTVVNRIEGPPSPDQTHHQYTYAKVQCLHCLDPACASACIVGALRRQPNGAVTYDADKCIGCRYCLVACPFQIPAYEYHEALGPRVRKCTYCFDQLTSHGEPAACAAACPTEAILFGKRRELVALAHQRIEQRPDRYVDHVYGEHEVGGTAWLYLAGRGFTELGLLELPDEPVPQLAEAIQHAIFKYFIPPLALYGLLAGVAWVPRRRKPLAQNGLSDAARQ